MPERDTFIQHLASCPACQTEVVSLSRAVELMRNDEDLGHMVLASSLPSVLGVSDALDDRFGGHARFVGAWAAAYGVMFGLAILVEGAYRFDVYGRQTLLAAVPMAIWCAASIVVAAWTDWRQTRLRQADGLYKGAAIVALAPVLALPLLYLSFPNVPVVEARFETHPMHAAFNKFVAYAVPMALAFFLVPLHFVMGMQHELRSPRRDLACEFLDRGRGLLPKATFYLAPWVLGLLFAAVLAHQYFGALYLFDNVLPGPYRALFVGLVQGRVAIYVVLAGGALVWYAHTLNELRRECLAWRALDEPRTGASRP